MQISLGCTPDGVQLKTPQTASRWGLPVALTSCRLHKLTHPHDLLAAIFSAPTLARAHRDVVVQGPPTFVISRECPDFAMSTPATAGSQHGSEPIYQASRVCSQLFDDYIVELKSHDEAHEVVEELRSRFKRWAAYVGALAVPRASLDFRLSLHDNLREMVLDLIYMLVQNLKWGMCTFLLSMSCCLGRLFGVEAETRQRRAEA